MTKYPKLAPAFDIAKQVFQHPLDKITTDGFMKKTGTKTVYNQSGNFPWDRLGCYLLQYPDIDLSQKPVVQAVNKRNEYDDEVFWGQIEPESSALMKLFKSNKDQAIGEPDVNAFYRK